MVLVDTGQTDVVSEVETKVPVFISYSHRDGEVHLIEYFVKLVADTEFRLQSSLQREAVFGCEDKEQGDVDVVVLYLNVVNAFYRTELGALLAVNHATAESDDVRQLILQFCSSRKARLELSIHMSPGRVEDVGVDLVSAKL